MEDPTGRASEPNGPPPEVAYERRIVSVLFADLVGFTSLAEQLDPEDVAAIQDRYFAAVRETVGRYGGVVEKFIGDAAMAAFGVPRARDDDAERAVRAGLAIANAVEELAGPLGLEPGVLAVRVGVTTGEVVHAASGQDEGRLSGDAVNTAARLQTAAPPGRVLLGETTALAVAETIELEPVTAITVKGRSEPVRVALAIGPRAVRSREAAMGGLRAPTLGRASELERLVAAAAATRAGGTNETWIVVAPPGVGKSRLLGDLATRLGSAPPGDGGVVGARFRAGDGRPFGALGDLAAAVIRGRSPDEVAAALRASGMAPGRADVVREHALALLGPDPGSRPGSGPGSGLARDLGRDLARGHPTHRPASTPPIAICCSTPGWRRSTRWPQRTVRGRWSGCSRTSTGPARMPWRSSNGRRRLRQRPGA